MSQKKLAEKLAVERMTAAMIADRKRWDRDVARRNAEPLLTGAARRKALLDGPPYPGSEHVRDDLYREGAFHEKEKRRGGPQGVEAAIAARKRRTGK